MPDLHERLLNSDPVYQDGVADGRNSAADSIREMIVRRFGGKVKSVGDDPAKLSIEMALSDIYNKLLFAETQRENRESALSNRDQVDQLAVRLLNLAAQQTCTHGERKGMIMLIAAFLEHYIGQSNGSDPVVLNDIPF